MKKNSKSVDKKDYKNPNQKWINLGFTYILVLVALVVLIYVLPRLTGLLTTTYTAQYGRMDVSDETQLYVVRNEEVFCSKTGGTVKHIMDNNELVRIGKTMASVEGSGEKATEDTENLVKKLGDRAKFTDAFVSDDGGFISYYVDGYEDVIRPTNMDTVKRKTLSDIKQENVIELKNGKISKKYPVVKLITKGSWYILAFIDKDSISRYSEGADVLVDVGKFAEKPIKMSVYSCRKEGDKGRLILVSDDYFKSIGNLRVTKGKIIATRTEGLVLQKKSLTEKDGQTGVYIKDKQGKSVFKPVLVLGTQADKVVVADSYFYDKKGNRVESISPYVDVIRSP